MMKIVDGSEFDVSKKTVAATKMLDDDEVLTVEMIKEQKYIIEQTKEGFFLRFTLEEIPEKKKGAVGVRTMKLSANDFVESIYFTQHSLDTTITYKSKAVELNKLKLGKRDTKGTKIRV